MSLCCVLNSQNQTANYCSSCGRYLKKYDNTQIPVTCINEKDRIVETHPSYAQVQIGRRYGGNRRLYGSLVSTSTPIYLTISASERITDDYSEHYHSNQEIIEVEMTPAQFSEMITNLNNGDGVPVTVTRLMGRHIPTPDNDLLGDRITSQVSGKFKEFSTSLDHLTTKAEELLTKKEPLKIVEKKELLNLLKKIVIEITNNLPFLTTVINENIEKSTCHAKLEIDALYSQVLTRLGVKTLDELKQLQIDGEVTNVQNTIPKKQFK